MSDEPKLGDSTRAVHGGEPTIRPSRSITPPVVLASTYPFENTDELHAFMRGEIERPAEYGRYGNPTVEAAEAKLAALEGAEACILMASGMAAVTTTLMSMLRSGQHAVFTADVYRKTRLFAKGVLARFGIETSIVPPDLASIEAAIQDNTKIIFTEGPTNPYVRMVDVEGMAKLAKPRRIKTILDATFATPVNMRPLEWGIDLVIHSTTKYLGGHNDLLGGALLGKAPLVGAIRDQMGTFGAIADPHNSYLLFRGLKTLALRVRQQNETALRLARMLEAHPKVSRVWYPMLESHPDHALASKYLRGGGGVISFEVADQATGTRVVDGTRIYRIAPSLGGVESLIEQPCLMSFYDLDDEQLAAVGIKRGLIRMSVGIEDPDDLEADLRRALDGA